MKAPKLKKDWVGLKVVTLREIRNRLTIIPAGTECIVEKNYGGLRLSTKPCKCCGVGIFITKVPEEDVDIIG